MNDPDPLGPHLTYMEMDLSLETEGDHMNDQIDSTNLRDLSTSLWLSLASPNGGISRGLENNLIDFF